MDEYNVKWYGQSKSSQDSMPLGGCDAGYNVWTENNRIYIYLAESGAFDENNTMIKLGRISIWFDDDEILGENYIQELLLYDGYIVITAGEGENRLEFKLWAETKASGMHIEYISSSKRSINLSYDSWRYREREVIEAERGQCRDYQNWKGKVFTYPDKIEGRDESLVFLHDNRKNISAYDTLIAQQGLDSIREEFPNWIIDRKIGGMISAKGMKYLGAQASSYQGVDCLDHMLRAESCDQLQIKVTLHIEQIESEEQWKLNLRKKNALASKHEASIQWWHDYFDKSFIKIGGPKWEIGRNYMLFRYMLGCNYYGKWPTKFNGGLFTFDEGFTPDYRNWSGGTFTIQNQRLVYWPMLKTGDFEAMIPQFDFFKNITNAGKARVMKFWNHEGACFSEQLNTFGMSCGSDYGWERDEELEKGIDGTPWIKYEYSNALEIALMILIYQEYSECSIECYMDYIKSVVCFYFEHYKLGENGKLSIFPSTALETYKGDEPLSKDEQLCGATNPLDAIAGLQTVLERLIPMLSGEEKKKFEEMLNQCPEIPTAYIDGKQVFLPAEVFNDKPFNCELPQLYKIFPYSPDGLSTEDITTGRNTYYQKHPLPDQYSHVSWHQNGIFAARLGLVEEAHKYLDMKFENAAKRFPAFWGPGHDWTPDHNWGGSGMIGLQEMLLQTHGDKIVLLPAWDRSIDVSFKLFAPHNTVVEVDFKDGKFAKVQVNPCHREKDIVFIKAMKEGKR